MTAAASAGAAALSPFDASPLAPPVSEAATVPHIGLVGPLPPGPYGTAPPLLPPSPPVRSWREAKYGNERLSCAAAQAQAQATAATPQLPPTSKALPAPMFGLRPLGRLTQMYSPASISPPSSAAMVAASAAATVASASAPNPTSTLPPTATIADAAGATTATCAQAAFPFHSLSAAALPPVPRQDLAWQDLPVQQLPLQPANTIAEHCCHSVERPLVYLASLQGAHCP